jgi:FAD/FMN-containing dehydrogenase
VIDVSSLSAIRVDPATGTASIGAGARLIDVYRVLAAHGVTIPGGTCPSVGIAGLALGGGIGYSGRKLGLTCDNVRDMTIVTADGVVRTCSATHNSDLFWACRGGGGGNFGIVTRFTFATHPVDTVTIYRAGWDWAKAANVVREWQAWAPTAPDALFSLLDLEARESGNTHIGSSGQLFGSAAELKAILAPFFAAGAQPATLEIRTLPYLDAMLLWAGCSDALHCRLGDGVARSIFAARSDYVAAALPAAGIGRSLHAVEARAATSGTVRRLLDASGGAINRVPPGATAFVHRRMAYPASTSPGGTRRTAPLAGSQHARGSARRTPRCDPSCPATRTRTTSIRSCRAGASPTTDRTTRDCAASSAATTRATSSTSRRASCPPVGLAYGETVYEPAWPIETKRLRLRPSSPATCAPSTQSTATA